MTDQTDRYRHNDFSFRNSTLEEKETLKKVAEKLSNDKHLKEKGILEVHFVCTNEDISLLYIEFAFKKVADWKAARPYAIQEIRKDYDGIFWAGDCEVDETKFPGLFI